MVHPDYRPQALPIPSNCLTGWRQKRTELSQVRKECVKKGSADIPALPLIQLRYMAYSHSFRVSFALFATNNIIKKEISIPIFYSLFYLSKYLLQKMM